jgi:molybdopterin-binding protein
VGEREFEAVGDVPEGERVLLCIRPENVTLAIGPPTEHTSARNIFKGVVERVVPLGPYQRVTLNCGFPLTALVTNHSAEELALRPGTVATVVVKATAIHVIRKSGGIR